jgi:23S rRNA pseudouridine1911/1915/1917 synthase
LSSEDRTTRLRVAPEQDGERLDRFLAAALTGATRGEVRRLIEQGSVRVGGRHRRKGDLVHAGEVVEVAGYVAPGAWTPRPDPSLEIAVLHEDPELLVVDKPPGVACHPLRPDELGTVASALVVRYPELCRAGDAPREAGLVHRLDTSTSGALVFARSRRAFDDLVGQMRGEGGDACVKVYDALVEGDAAGLGTIELPLRSRGQRSIALTGGVWVLGAQPARTEVRAVRRVGEFTLVEARIATGRRHQIRAHLAAVGHPIAGDALYGAHAPAPLARPFLHARAVTVRQPATGSPLTVEAPLAPDLAAALERLEAASDPGG